MNANTKRRQRKIRKEVIEANRIRTTTGQVSLGDDKNVVMVVSHNTLPDGRKMSVTTFERKSEKTAQYRRAFKPTRDKFMGRDELIKKGLELAHEIQKVL